MAIANIVDEAHSEDDERNIAEENKESDDEFSTYFSQRVNIPENDKVKIG